MRRSFLALAAVLLGAGQASAQGFTCPAGQSPQVVSITPNFHTTYVGTSTGTTFYPSAGESAPELWQVAKGISGSFTTRFGAIEQYNISSLAGHTVKTLVLELRAASISPAGVTAYATTYGKTGYGSPQPASATDAQLLAAWKASDSFQAGPAMAVPLATYLHPVGTKGIARLQAAINAHAASFATLVVPPPAGPNYTVNIQTLGLRVGSCH